MVAIRPKTPSEVGHAGEELAMLLGLGHINEEHGYIPQGSTVHLWGPVAAYPVYASTRPDHKPDMAWNGSEMVMITRVRWIGWAASRRLRRTFYV